MSHSVKKILIVTKLEGQIAASLGIEMADFLRSQGVETTICVHQADACGVGEESVELFDLILVLGGDGTFIGVARQLLFLKTPLMGVNLGRVGFLTQLHQAHWQHWLSKVLTDGFETASRLALKYEVLRQGKCIHTGLVVNDLVISRGELARLIRLNIAYDTIPISTVRADGIIISTPTGSSAYGASAGGPLMHADLSVFCVTPVCPFLNSFMPIVLPASGACLIRVEEASGEVNLTEDGQSLVSLVYGDEVVVSRSETDLLVVDLGPEAYFEKLKKHGFLTER